MKQLFILLIFNIITTHINAQQMISVIDTYTREPIANVIFIHDGKNISYTSPQGIAVLPKLSGKVTITAQDYETLVFHADSIPAIIHLQSKAKNLEEIVVLGDANKFKSLNKWNNLKKSTHVNSNGSVGIGIDAIFRFFGYRPASERRRERVKKLLKAYDEPVKDKKK